MYQIAEEYVKKLMDINLLLNKLEIRGASNVDALYSSMVLLKQVVDHIYETNQDNLKLKGGEQ